MARRVITLRASDQELAAWKQAAGAADLSKWIRAILNQQAGMSGTAGVPPANHDPVGTAHRRPAVPRIPAP